MPVTPPPAHLAALMLLAQLHGKLPTTDEDLEDLLTSNVFGAFKYSGRIEALQEFLGRALPRSGAAALELPPITHADYRLWPWLDGDREVAGCEPDVVLRLEHADGTGSLVGVEAKLNSGKSSRPTDGAPITDQLAREWLALRRLAATEGRSRCILVYLTAHTAPPWADLDQTQRELDQKRPGVVADLRWLSWRVLPRLLAGRSDPIFIDLACLLRRAGLTWFEALPEQLGALPPPYRFCSEAASAAQPAPGTFSWQPPVHGPRFTFITDLRHFRWSPAPPLAPWRFSP